MEDLQSKPLSRVEASIIARWLMEQKKKDVPQGWISVYKLIPAEVAEMFEVSEDEVIEASRRNVG